ncbi:MAG TPA: hypothetical protein VEF76_04745 [Patescibacteria group bacterium]|nr:hypothetical protein [Patescibacteria group bacterium]
MFSFLLPLTLVAGIICFAALAEDSHHSAPSTPTLLIAATPGALNAGEEYSGVLTLQSGAAPLTLAGLEERHTQKIHLLVIDQSLGDYHHLHPTAGVKPGEYKFSFTPRTGHNYRVYADVKPLGAGPQMVMTEIKGNAPCDKPCIDRNTGDIASVGNIAARVQFAATPVVAGTPVDATIELKDEKGNPLADLEPVMGAYGHIVGFYAEGEGVAHMHPSGDEPTKPTDRGSSPLRFMLHPDHAGYLKYFVQIRRGGEEIFLPFGLYIEKPKS